MAWKRYSQALAFPRVGAFVALELTFPLDGVSVGVCGAGVDAFD